MKNLLKKGFTLIELLIVIAIIGIMVALVLPNLAGARERARDSRRKTDLNSIQQALRLYYNDNQTFPTTDSLAWGHALQSPTGTLYMSILPYDPSSTSSTNIEYDYVSDGKTYYLVATLENKSDSDIEASHSRCAGPNTELAYVVCEE
jgi:general secretion pathway protein G